MARYWVGTDGAWSDTANWSDTTGGTGGFSVPTASDDVFFDASSGSGTVTVDVSSVCDDLDFTGFTGTFAGSAALAISGSLTLATGMTRTYTGAITFNATSTGKTLTFNGKTTASAVTFNGTGGGWTVQDTWNNGTSDITLTAGTLNTNGQTITCAWFVISGSSTRSLDLGSSTINCYLWNASTTTNLTFTVGTSTINCTTGNTTSIFLGGGLTYNVVTMTPTNVGPLSVTGANTFGTLTITGLASKIQSFTLSANQTVTGTLTIAGNSLTNRLLIQSSTLGTARTITAATTTLSNCDFMDITGAGAGSWSGTSIGNALGNSGITFTTPVTRYAVAAGNWSNTATWSTSSGGSGGASVPLCHDTVILDANSGAGTYTADMPRLGADITCTGFTRTLTTSTAASIYGSLTLASGMTLTASTQTYTFRGRSSHTLTSAGKTWNKQLGIKAVGGTYTLQDALVTTSNFNPSYGTFDANDQNVTVGSCDLNCDVVYMGSGTWEVTGEYFFDFSDTTYPETATILLSSTAYAIYGKSDVIYNKLKLTGSGTFTYLIRSSHSFTTFESDKTVDYSIQFAAGTTQTITNWNVSGTSGNLVSLTSSSTANYTLTKAGGGQVRADYLDIRHCVATPSDTWYAGVNSTDNQSIATAGSGWIFGVPLPTVTTQAVSDISDLTATANGNITDDGSGILSERGFVYDTVSRAEPGNVAPASSGYASAITENGTYSEGAFTGSLTSLIQNTTYYVRAYTENEAGFDYGAEVSFTTLETPLVPEVTTQAVSSVATTTATGNGTIVDENGSDVTRRGFVLSTSTQANPGSTSPEASAYSIIASDSGSFSVGAYTKSITGLTTQTTYYIRAFTENSLGFAYGDELSFVTAGLPTATIQSPSARQSTTATLNGTVSDDGELSVTARGFVYDTVSRVLPGNVAPASSGYASTAGDTGTFTEGTFNEPITGLTQNTTYYARAYAQNSVGYRYSDELTFSTLVFPNSTSVTNGTTNSVTLTNKQTTGVAIINLDTTTTNVTNL